VSGSCGSLFIPRGRISIENKLTRDNSYNSTAPFQHAINNGVLTAGKRRGFAYQDRDFSEQMFERTVEKSGYR
jgi:hypothetical protein